MCSIWKSQVKQPVANGKKIAAAETHTHTLTQCSIGTDGLATEIDQEKYLSWNTASGTTKK